MPDHDVAVIRSTVRRALSGRPRAVLAVSGGLDSMALLDAAAAVVRPDRVVVATFDHGTSGVTAAAAALVEARAGSLGLRAVRGRAERPGTSEAEWRATRWAFLTSVAAAEEAAVFTAHTRDDQIETVLMRVLRDAGARGLAGLYAAGPVVRPLIDVSRAEVYAYARARGLTWIEDPTNASRRFLRNRIRHDLLPALRRGRPSIDVDLLAIAKGAAAWRAEVDAVVSATVPLRVRDLEGGIDVAALALQLHAASDSLAIVWPAVVAGIGLVLDRRGTSRLVSFTRTSRVGSRIQVSGGWQVTRSREWFEVRRIAAELPASRLEADGGRWGSWEFRPTANVDGSDAWTAWLPDDSLVYVRAWRPGDVLVGPSEGGDRRGRKVKRLLSAAGVTGHARRNWPVVVAGSEVIWVPGVSRSDMAAERSGRLTERRALPFRCENLDR